MGDRYRRKSMTEQQLGALAAAFPLGRIGQSDDVAAAVLCLASSASPWVTGVPLDVPAAG